MSTVKSLCCLETVAGTSRSGLVAELSLDTSFVCRRPLILSLLVAGRKALELFFCGCKFVFLSGAAVFCNLTGRVCAVDDRLSLAGVANRCVVFIIGVVVLDAGPLDGKPVPHAHHCYNSNHLSSIIIQLMLVSIICFNKCSTVAEMGDHLATIHMRRKWGDVPHFLGGGAGSQCNTMWLRRGLTSYQVAC